jgi:S1-C subfamily serine protease
MSEYGDFVDYREVTKPATEQLDKGPMPSVVFRYLPSFLASIALCLTVFIPWIQVRLPGLDRRSVSLFDLDGGRVFVGLSILFLLFGFALVARIESFGIVLISIGVAILGWLAGFVMVVVSLVRGMIPSVAFAGVDLSEGLIGQGSGTILAVVCTIFLGMQLTVRINSRNDPERVISNPWKLVIIAFALILAICNHLPWLIAEAGSVSGRLEISGDSLFGNFFIGLITWFVVTISSVALISKAPLAEKIGALGLLVLAIFKLIQLIFLWAGSGLVAWVLPGGIESIANSNLQIAFFVSLVTSVLAVPVSIIFLISQTKDSFRQFKFPDLIVSIVLVVVSIGFVALPVSGANEVNKNQKDATVPSVQESESSVTANQSSAYLSVVYIEMTDGVEACWSGSGVFVGDGTRVLTNAHVAAADSSDPVECNQLFVGITTSISEEPDEFFEAIPIEIDEANDLAILELVGVSPGQFPVLKPNFDELVIGSNVEVLGYPGIGGSTVTLTKGTIAGVLDNDSGFFYKVEVTINRGNSGGPMLNEDGELVGIATQVTGNDVECSGSDCQSYGANLGLVRPISFAKSLIER